MSPAPDRESCHHFLRRPAPPRRTLTENRSCTRHPPCSLRCILRHHVLKTRRGLLAPCGLYITSILQLTGFCPFVCFFFFFVPDPWDGDMAQLVQRPTEKPDAILIGMTRVRVPSEARDFSLRVDFQWRLSYGVRTAPVYYRMLQHLCAR